MSAVLFYCFPVFLYFFNISTLNHHFTTQSFAGFDGLIFHLALLLNDRVI